MMTGGGTLAGGVYLIDMDPETGKLQFGSLLPAAGSGLPGIRFDCDEWPRRQDRSGFRAWSGVWFREMINLI